MKIEQQVVSLELSKKLKGLGYEQEEVWCWYEDMNKRTYQIGIYASYRRDCVAPTASELLERLPNVIVHRLYLDPDYGKKENWKTGHWTGGYKTIHWAVDYKQEKSCNDKSLPNALAKMWIYLNQQGLLKGGWGE